MTISKTALWLTMLVAGLALVAALVGLLYPPTGSAFSFTTVHGATVELYGQGWYQLDTPIAAVGFMAADMVTLVMALPLLIMAALFYRRRSLKGGFLLSGTLAYFLYNYGSLAFGATYNHLYLIYTVIFSASLFSLLAVLLSFDVTALPGCFSTRLPRRSLSVFLIASGVILLLVWLMLSIVPALLQGTAPLEAAYYTTFTTGVIDIAIVAPALIAAGLLLYRRVPLGYLLAATLLVFTVTLGVNLTVAGIAQLVTGVISLGQAMGFTMPFVILTLIAAGFAVSVFQNFTEPQTGDVALNVHLQLGANGIELGAKYVRR